MIDLQKLDVFEMDEIASKELEGVLFNFQLDGNQAFEVAVAICAALDFYENSFGRIGEFYPGVESFLLDLKQQLMEKSVCAGEIVDMSRGRYLYLHDTLDVPFAD